MLDKNKIAERLKFFREHLPVKTSAAKFASKAKGVDSSQYSKFEKHGAESKGLGHDKIRELCSTWNINIDWLLTGKGNMNGFKAQDDETIQEMSPADGAKETAPELGAIERVLLELENLKIGQTRIYNQVINARQDVEAVSDYIMLKDANWDLD